MFAVYCPFWPKGKIGFANLEGILVVLMLARRSLVSGMQVVTYTTGSACPESHDGFPVDRGLDDVEEARGFLNVQSQKVCSVRAEVGDVKYKIEDVVDALVGLGVGEEEPGSESGSLMIWIYLEFEDRRVSNKKSIEKISKTRNKDILATWKLDWLGPIKPQSDNLQQSFSSSVTTTTKKFCSIPFENSASIFISDFSNSTIILNPLTTCDSKDFKSNSVPLNRLNLYITHNSILFISSYSKLNLTYHL
ncbi:hypothetical protein PPACK8108_LOCUS21152 [Phakopsora pachyrhizi]|uniref:Uncharacterized protein n=1 Tax=Phakopsora pachyrhizi TaxID=170000 RepID=A0AAV0BGS9_PHAPC|nr:hypothetical protein PPACK8108_LOCUS21152 [Phakopsora pachyrhizi]